MQNSEIETSHNLLQSFYTKYIPRINLRKVYQTVDDNWVLLERCHFNTGFIERHLTNESFLLGYENYNDITKHFIIETDNTQEAIDHVRSLIKEKPSNTYVFKKKHDSFIHFYYVLEEEYYIKDLTHSLLLKYPTLSKYNILPNINKDIIPLPLGVDSSNLYSDNKSLDGIDKLKEAANSFREIPLKKICPLKKITFKWDSKHKDYKDRVTKYASLSVNNGKRNKYPSIGFYEGNVINSVIQLFNKYYPDRDKFLEECKKELETSKLLYKNLDLEVHRDIDDCLDYFISFYMKLEIKRVANNYKTDSNFIKTNLTQYQLFMIKKHLRSFPEYKNIEIKGLSEEKAKSNFISFSLKIISLFLNHSQFSEKNTYFLPSTFLLKLSKHYRYYLNILLPYISKVDKEYYHSNVAYRCRGYNIDLFKMFIRFVFNKYKLNLGYYKIDTSYKNSNIDYSNIYNKYINIHNNILNPVYLKYVLNYYNIFPDLKKHLKGMRGIMSSLGCFWEESLGGCNKRMRKWMTIEETAA